jgi:hypothetical protein
MTQGRTIRGWNGRPPPRGTPSPRVILPKGEHSSVLPRRPPRLLRRPASQAPPTGDLPRRVAASRTPAIPKTLLGAAELIRSHSRLPSAIVHHPSPIAHHPTSPLPSTLCRSQGLTWSESGPLPPYHTLPGRSWSRVHRADPDDTLDQPQPGKSPSRQQFQCCSRMSRPNIAWAQPRKPHFPDTPQPDFRRPPHLPSLGQNAHTSHSAQFRKKSLETVSLWSGISPS